MAANNTYALIFWCSFKYNDQWWSYCSDFFWGKPGTLFSAWNDTVNAAIAKLRNAVPQLKILPFINSSLNILDQIEQFPDSQVRDQDGNLFYYPGNGDHGWLVLTTQTNSYGQALADMITSLIEEYQVDGLYWDEFSGAGYGDNLLIPHSTFNASDNHTALVDPTTKQIVITAAKTRIVTAPWTLETLDRLKAYDAPLITNSAPVTKAFSDLEVPRFVETQANIDRTYETNLYSPLCLTSWYDISQAVERLEMGGIPFRVSDSGITPHMSKFFPLTPIEIHRGWILAHERLLSKYTGTYSWDHTVTGTLYRYDLNGDLVDQTYRSLPAAGGSIDVPPDGLAIFVRDDLPKTCYEAQQVGYGMQTDLNPDCYINWSDFSVFAGHWLFDQCGAAADFDGSCLVDWGDFSIFASTWLDCNDPQNVPPCTASW